MKTEKTNRNVGKTFSGRAEKSHVLKNVEYTVIDPNSTIFVNESCYFSEWTPITKKPENISDRDSPVNHDIIF